MSVTVSLAESLQRVLEHSPAPWFGVVTSGGQEPSAKVYSADQNVDTDAPIMSGALDTCRLVIQLVNRESKIERS